MDGLPKNKKPWGKAEPQKQIGLDNYLFERKLQEVYDDKPASNDLPRAIKAVVLKVSNLKLKRQRAKTQKHSQQAGKRHKKVQLIDAPHVPKRRFLVKKQAVQADTAPKRIRRIRVSVKRQHIVFAGVAVAILGVAYGVMRINSRKPHVTSVTGEGQVKGTSSAQKPDFDTLTPKDNPSTPIKFDPSKKVASFRDTIQGFAIVVSQQKLGETELKDTDFLRRTAVNFNLKTEVTTRKGQAFIGVNIDKNTQFVMFIYQDFLFFIQADTTFKNQVIVDYIDTLQ